MGIVGSIKKMLGSSTSYNTNDLKLITEIFLLFFFFLDGVAFSAGNSLLCFVSSVQRS